MNDTTGVDPWFPPRAAEWCNRHQIVASCLAILLFPIVLAMVTYYTVEGLRARGHGTAAVLTAVVGMCLAIGGAAWWISASGEHSPTRPTNEPGGNFMGYVDYDACRDAGYGRLDCLYGEG